MKLIHTITQQDIKRTFEYDTEVDGKWKCTSLNNDEKHMKNIIFMKEQKDYYTMYNGQLSNLYPYYIKLVS